MKATFVSVNELRFLKEVLEELIELGASDDLNNALSMIEGFINESVLLSRSDLDKLLEANEVMLNEDLITEVAYE